MEEEKRGFTGRVTPREMVREFWPSGRMKSERGLREDGREAWTFWYPDGTVQQDVVPTSKPGMVTVRRYRPDGSLKSTIDYREGRKHGAWCEYAPDGNLLRERRYEDGKPVA